MSLASRGSVLGKAVLGLGLVFFCVLGLEPCVLDSSSDNYNVFKVGKLSDNGRSKVQSITILLSHKSSVYFLTELLQSKTVVKGKINLYSVVEMNLESITTVHAIYMFLSPCNKIYLVRMRLDST